MERQIFKGPMKNRLIQELVTVIDPKRNIEKEKDVGENISLKEAEAIIWKNFYPGNKHTWSLKGLQYKEGILICGYNDLFPDAIGIWWCKGAKVYNVNGIARSKTEKLKLSMEHDVPTLYKICKERPSDLTSPTNSHTDYYAIVASQDDPWLRFGCASKGLGN